MTQEDMKALESYEYTFRTAIENGFARHFGSKQYTALKTIYERITGHKLNVNFSCPHCSLDFIKRLGKMYFEAKEHYAKVQTEPEPNDVTASEPKKKTTRKKKVATNNEQKSE